MVVVLVPKTEGQKLMINPTSQVKSIDSSLKLYRYYLG